MFSSNDDDDDDDDDDDRDDSCVFHWIACLIDISTHSDNTHTHMTVATQMLAGSCRISHGR